MPREAHESSPRCPRCRYRLHGLREARCPECGLWLDDEELLMRSRWLSDDNKANRQAVLAESLAGALGIVLICGGMAVAVGRASRYSFVSGLVAWRLVGIPIIATAGYLWYRARLGEPMKLTLLVVGVVWLLFAIVLLFLF